MKNNKLINHTLMLAVGLLLSAGASQAALYHVSLNTSALVGNPAGPFSLDFQFNSGGDLNNNTAIISNFTFDIGGGAPFGPANLIGGASGDISSVVTMSDSSAFNEFYQEFTPGGSLNFDLNLTQNMDGGGTPDLFSVSILDSGLGNITTDGVGNSLVILTIDDTAPGGSIISTGTGTGSFAGISVTAVPEPSAALSGLLAGGLMMMRRRRAA
jgi:hypothetical protein